jgi:hypothetical protein
MARYQGAQVLEVETECGFLRISGEEAFFYFFSPSPKALK